MLLRFQRISISVTLGILLLAGQALASALRFSDSDDELSDSYASASALSISDSDDSDSDNEATAQRKETDLENESVENLRRMFDKAMDKEKAGLKDAMSILYKLIDLDNDTNETRRNIKYAAECAMDANQNEDLVKLLVICQRPQNGRAPYRDIPADILRQCEEDDNFVCFQSLLTSELEFNGKDLGVVFYRVFSGFNLELFKSAMDYCEKHKIRSFPIQFGNFLQRIHEKRSHPNFMSMKRYLLENAPRQLGIKSVDRNTYLNECFLHAVTTGELASLKACLDLENSEANRITHDPRILETAVLDHVCDSGRDAVLNNADLWNLMFNRTSKEVRPNNNVIGMLMSQGARCGSLAFIRSMVERDKQYVRPNTEHLVGTYRLAETHNQVAIMEYLRPLIPLQSQTAAAAHDQRQNCETALVKSDVDTLSGTGLVMCSSSSTPATKSSAPKEVLDTANQKEDEIRNAQEKTDAIAMIMKLYERHASLTEKEKIKIQSNLGATIKADNVERVCSEFAVIPIRNLTKDKLVIACGNFPFMEDVSYQIKHAHWDADTINPNILMNPSIIAGFPPAGSSHASDQPQGDVSVYLQAKAKKYSEIFIEGFCVFSLLPYPQEQNLINLHRLLKPQGLLISNMNSMRIYNDQFIQSNLISVDTRDQLDAHLFVKRSQDYISIVTHAELLSQYKRIHKTTSNQRIIDQNLYSSLDDELNEIRSKDEKIERLESKISGLLKALIKTDPLERLLNSYGFTFEGFTKAAPDPYANHYLLGLTGHFRLRKI
jgi:hypothetical protein